MKRTSFVGLTVSVFWQDGLFLLLCLFHGSFWGEWRHLLRDIESNVYPLAEDRIFSFMDVGEKRFVMFFGELKWLFYRPLLEFD